MIVYISIGNSDDKLSQAQWAEYFSNVALGIHGRADVVHGQWVSEPASAWQNACWCVTFAHDMVVTVAGLDVLRVDLVRDRLAQLARDYRQDSIAWSEAEPEFLSAAPNA